MASSVIALVARPASTPDRLRIGKETHGYIYAKVVEGIYKCERGSDWKEEGQLLWLFKHENGSWQACDGHDGEEVTQMGGGVRFSSCENVLAEGNHDWTMRMDPQHRLGTFATTLLD